MKAVIVGAPPGYDKTLGRVPQGVTLKKRLAGDFDFIHLFAANAAEFNRRLPKAVAAMSPGAMLWVSWPKGTSQLETDLNGNIVRSTILKRYKKLVDIKVCAVDGDWSGLKFVFRRS